MPMVVNLGLTKKNGLPDYGSLDASCSVSLELDSALLQQDLDGFHRHVRHAYVACRQAIEVELARQRQTLALAGGTATAANLGPPLTRASANGRPPRFATARQVRALHGLARRQGLDLVHDLISRFSIQQPDELTIAQASQLIDQLRTAPAEQGVPR